jgi:hypothetical protein
MAFFGIGALCGVESIAVWPFRRRLCTPCLVRLQYLQFFATFRFGYSNKKQNDPWD